MLMSTTDLKWDRHRKKKKKGFYCSFFIEQYIGNLFQTPSLHMAKELPYSYFYAQLCITVGQKIYF